MLNHFQRHILSSSAKFCSKSTISQTPKPLQQLQDWQYVKKISKYLKKNKVNDALNCLINSNLHNKVLDIQIYHAMHLKINKLNMPLNYHEIIYKLYREHFHPNSLMINWMSKLVNSQDQKLLKLLREDYEKINIKYPECTVENKKQEEKKKDTADSKKQKSKEKQDSSENSNKNQGVKLSSMSLVFEKKDAKNDQKTAFQIQPQDIKTMFSMFIENYSRVKIADEMQEDVDERQQLIDDKNSQNQSYDEYFQKNPDQNMSQIPFYSFKKIKIGSIDLFGSKFILKQ